MRAQRAVAVLFVLAALPGFVACQAESEEPDVVAVQMHGQFACFRCHSRRRIQGIKPVDGSGMAGYLRAAKGGLKRRPVIVPDGRDHYSLDLLGLQEGRGRHPGMDRERCFDCHPVQPNGMGHGARVYPEEAMSFTGGRDCAGACHTWLSSYATVQGASGTSWLGSQRPGDLLAGKNNPHSQIWREGWIRKEGDKRYVVTAIAPGCTGCHNIAGVSHGDKPSCLDCHAWDNHDANGGQHQKHIGFAGTTLPDGATRSCGWCHAFGAPDSKVAAGACYNCHLSGHAPRGTDGSPQLWP